jgi:hypothetical protein
VRRVLPIALLFAFACAGPGHFYPCDADAGADCGVVLLPDGGRTDTPFVAPAVTVWHDGQHDASTDVIRFAGALFSVFRHAPDWQPDPAAQLFVLRSDDKGQTWSKAAALTAAGRDLREPKLVLFQNKLWVTATAWDTTDPTRHRTSIRAAVSDDGAKFTATADVTVSPGLEAWRPRVVGSALVLAAWNADELFPSSNSNQLGLLSSSDGLLFAAPPAPLPAGPGAREGELLVRQSGDSWLALPERAIDGAPDRQTFCHAKGLAGWTCWSVAGQRVDGPALFEWNGILFLAGRHDIGGGRKRTAVWQVLEDDHALSLIADLAQSFGETGGPGVVQLDADHELLTFHSTSTLDPKLAGIGHEPTEVESQSLGLATDVLSVQLFMPGAAAGR